MNLEWPEVVRRRNLDKEGLIRKKIKNKFDADEKNGQSEQETKVEADQRAICTIASNWDSHQEEDCLCRCSTCGQLSVRDHAVRHFILGYTCCRLDLLRGIKIVSDVGNNGAATLNTAFRFRSESASAPFHSVLLSFLDVLPRS